MKQKKLMSPMAADNAAKTAKGSAVRAAKPAEPARQCRTNMTAEEIETEKVLRRKGLGGAMGLGWGSRANMAAAQPAEEPAKTI